MIFPTGKLIDIMDTQLQLVKRGYTLGDLTEIPLYELDMLVVVVNADRDRQTKQQS